MEVVTPPTFPTPTHAPTGLSLPVEDQRLQTARASGFGLIPIVIIGAMMTVLYAAPTFAQSPAPTCMQPAEGAQIVPTRIFQTIYPHKGQRTLVNPLNPADTGPLTVLALGDSAIWGDGLDDEHKYSHQVARHLADATQRPVTLITYAHSGANLSTEAGAFYEPLRPTDDGRPPGDLNAGLPTTLQQEGCAAMAYPRAELILLDGCLNDVSAFKVALPFPFSGATEETIRRSAYRQCSNAMVTLLGNAQSHFRTATLVVANYWLIISKKSSPVGVIRSKGGFRATSADHTLNTEFETLLAAQRKAERETEGQNGGNFVESDLATHPETIFLNWAANSEAFLDVSQHCFEWAVSIADGKTPMPAAPATQDDHCPIPSGDAEIGPQPVTSNMRVFLATVPTKPEYSYGAGRLKRVWSVPGLLGHPLDQVYAVRHVLCETHYPAGGNRFICTVNPTAHPNVPGANAYTKSINTILDSAWKSP